MVEILHVVSLKQFSVRFPYGAVDRRRTETGIFHVSTDVQTLNWSNSRLQRYKLILLSFRTQGYVGDGHHQAEVEEYLRSRRRIIAIFTYVLHNQPNRVFFVIFGVMVLCSDLPEVGEAIVVKNPSRDEDMPDTWLRASVQSVHVGFNQPHFLTVRINYL